MLRVSGVREIKYDVSNTILLYLSENNETLIFKTVTYAFQTQIL